MCTVTYIPVGSGFIITSSRDEQFSRPPALRPAIYLRDGNKILYPKDTKAGGTWFALHENGNALVFLNGAAEKHRSLGNYKKSRGLLLLDMIAAENPADYFNSVSFDGMEPFTAIIAVPGSLLQARWNGEEKELKSCDAATAHIWSSATLYDTAAREKRAYWFSEWLEETSNYTQQEAIYFHLNGGKGDSYNGIYMDRPGAVRTVSICSLLCTNEEAVMRYYDCVNEVQSTVQFPISKDLPANT